MPRSGGDSDKLGNRYEGWWTVNNLIDVLAGDAVALQPEAYDESIGVEFIKTLPNSSQEFHSVKRQRAGSGWTLSALASVDQKGRSVLKDLFDKLNTPAPRAVVFVSTTVHSQALELWDRSQRCATPEEFKLQLQTAKGLHEDFTKYVLPFCNNDLAIALRRLHALRLESQSESGLRHQVETSIRRLLYKRDGQPVDSFEVVLKLADFICSSLGRRLVENDVRSELERHGYHLRDWTRDTHVPGQVRALNQRYLKYVEADLILGRSIPRSEATTVTQILQETNGKLAQLIVGAAGRGKSCVLTQIIRGLEAASVPFLAFRLDNIPNINSTRALGRELELPESPVIVLAGLSQGRRAVLIVDQLDAMSIVSGRNPDLWQIFQELLEELRQHPNLRLLLACRAFDLEHDTRLASLVKTEGPAQRVELGLLPIETVKEVVHSVAGLSECLSTKELEVLRTPFHLHLFLHGEPANPISFGGTQELFARFWKTKRQRATDKNINFEQVVGLLTDELSRSESISTPVDRLDSVSRDADILVSDNVLVSENGRYRFFHESFFDYAFARRFVREGRNLVHFLTQECSEQHLFRRAQVRQVLVYQREDNQHHYLTTLSDLLYNQSIRIHLKKLALDWVAQLEEPTEGEWQIIEPILKQPELFSAAFNVLWGKLPWFDLLYGTGVLARLLRDSDSVFVSRCVRAFTLPEFLKHRPSQVASLLRVYQRKGSVWTVRFKEAFRLGQFYHSREMFDFVLGLAEEGLFDDGDELRWHSFTEMAKDRPQFAAELLACTLKRMILKARTHGEMNPFSSSVVNEKIDPTFIAIIAEKAPQEFAERILPIVKALVLQNAKPAKCGGFFDEIWHYIRFGPEHDTDEVLLGSARRALQALAKADPDKCNALLAGWENLEHKTLQFLLTCAWLGNPSYFAETAANQFINKPLTFIVSCDFGIGVPDIKMGALSLLKAISPIIKLDNPG